MSKSIDRRPGIEPYTKLICSACFGFVQFCVFFFCFCLFCFVFWIGARSSQVQYSRENKARIYLKSVAPANSFTSKSNKQPRWRAGSLLGTRRVVSTPHPSLTGHCSGGRVTLGVCMHEFCKKYWFSRAVMQDRLAQFHRKASVMPPPPTPPWCGFNHCLLAFCLERVRWCLAVLVRSCDCAGLMCCHYVLIHQKLQLWTDATRCRKDHK